MVDGSFFALQPPLLGRFRGAVSLADCAVEADDQDEIAG